MSSSPLNKALRYILEARDNNESAVVMLSQNENWNKGQIIQDLKAKAIADKIRYDKIIALITGIMNLPDKE